MIPETLLLATPRRKPPFGNTVSSTGSEAVRNRYRFSSKEIHANSGMYYYLYRFYDPNLQRWINRDPIQELGGLNLYAFLQNAPTTVVDPFGLEGKLPTDPGWWLRLIKLLGSLLGG